MKKIKILLLSPHTDDVELGAGGTVARFLEEGHDVKWVVFSVAEDSVPGGFPRDALKKEFLEVAKKLGLEKYTIYDFKVRCFHEKRQEILESLIKIRQEFSPDLVIMPSLNDFHQDHHVVAMEGLRAFNKRSNILGYEIPWNKIGFSPTFFFRLSERHVKRKMDMLSCYNTQKSMKRGYFSEDFIRGLARVRGVQSDNDYAEAFEVIRWRQ